MLAIAMIGQLSKKSVKRHPAPRNKHQVQMSILALQMRRIRRIYAELETNYAQALTLCQQPIQSNQDDESI